MARSSFPDGIDQEALKSRGSGRVILLRFLIFIVILALALAGLFGGGGVGVRSVDTPAARLSLEAAERIRNGNYFEARIGVEAHLPIARPVIAVPASLWQDSTINSLIPDPEGDEYKDGEYRFRFGPLAAGERFEFKIDGQINPELYGRLKGDYRLLDGNRELARLHSKLTVIP